MDQKLAVLFMPDDMTLTKEKTPLMLQPILFCPILTWMIDELMGQGVERFFINRARVPASAQKEKAEDVAHHDHSSSPEAAASPA